MPRHRDYLEVLLGAGLAAGTILDIVPGDELVGIPLGIVLILEGFGYI